MKTKYILLILLIFSITGSAQLFSQNIPDSLLMYMEVAAKNNPAVMQRYIEYEAALKKIPQAGALPDPQLDLGVFIKPMELPGGNQVADMKLMQMFPWFGVLKNARDEMSLMAMAKFELFRDRKLQVFYEVQKTWYDLFRVRKDIRISEKNIEVLLVIEKLALAKYKAPIAGSTGSTPIPAGQQMQSGLSTSVNSGSGMQGMSDKQTGREMSSSGQATGQMQAASMSSSDGPGLTDLYRIQIEAGDLKNNIANLKSMEQSIVARFNSYLNRSPLSEVYTGETLMPDTLGLDLLMVPDTILENNPMLNMLKYEKEAYSSKLKMVTGMGYPMIGIGLNYSILNRSDMVTSSMNGKDMIMPMVSVTLPIYRKKYNAMRQEAELLSQATSLNYQDVSNSLNSEYYSAVQSYQDALRRIKLYEDQYKLASSSFTIMLKSFTASAVTLTDVLRIRQQTLDYELKKVEAVTDLNTAKAWLIRLMASSEIQ